MATAEKLHDRAAQDLGILRLNATLQAQDATRMEEAYEEVYASLKKEGIATWAYDGDVPAEVVPHVAALMAENCLNTYSVSDKRYVRITRSASKAKREIRAEVQDEYVSQDDPKDY